MYKEEYKKMDDFEKNYWWHKGKRYLIQLLISEYFEDKKLNILEVGCGAGELTKILQKNHNVYGIDISEDAINLSKAKGLKNVELKDIFDFDISKHEGKYDLVLALDVLEHIQEDVEAMERVYELLKPDGYFFVNVPAHKFLWSEHDEALQHKRRYTRYELTQKLQRSGFEIIKESYFVSFVFPVIVLYRTWGNLFSRSAYPKTSYVKLPNTLNNILTKALYIEANLLKKFNLRLGTTITVIAQKNTN